MNRRELLKSSAMLGAVALAGCSDSDPAALLAPASAQGVATPPSFNREILEPEIADTIAAVVLQPGFGPVPFKASDEMTHLTYELLVTNRQARPIRIDQVEVFSDADHDRVLFNSQFAGVSAIMTLLSGGPDIDQLQPSQTGIVYLDVLLPLGQRVPEILVHRVSGTDLEQNKALPVVLGGRTRVRSDIAAPILTPPAFGTGWVSAEACCGRSHHRRGPFSLNGELYLSQRYAIDFVRLVDGALAAGDPKVLSNWHCYGVELLAVAGGVVASVLNDQPEFIPLEPIPVALTKQTAAGNHVVVDMGNGLSYVFAHMQTGSARVRVGDRVSPGQPLGLVGNSGNTSAPHLHMHVMSGRDIFQGHGIPYGFDDYTISARFPTLDDLLPDDGGPAVNEISFPPRRVQNAYPLELTVIEF